ncbi:MAG: TetR/AcrR family transcriptional regulator [Dethiobacteraceae bacterium]|jgi:AcrR family transcriptional regulator|nr:TetR/AcrR family transcriptional regulator [Bacillota bacterium]
MRVTKDAEVRRQEILETAMLLFEQNGINKTSMNDIAKAAAITKGLVYYYFSSKEELVTAVIDLVVEQINQQLQEIVQAPSLNFYEKLAEILLLYLVAIKERHKLIDFSPATTGVYELVKNRLTESALLYTKDFIRQAVEAGILTIDYPEYTLKILINGLADLYVEGVQEPKVLAVLIEQSLGLPKGSIKLS